MYGAGNSPTVYTYDTCTLSWGDGGTTAAENNIAYCELPRSSEEVEEEFDAWAWWHRQWLDGRWAQALIRRLLPAPQLAIVAARRAWAASVQAWAYQEARMRKGLRQST